MSAEQLASALYTGRLAHRRRAPFEHSFDYRLYMLLLDLGELDRIFARRWLWSVDRRNVVELRTADYLGGGGQPLETRACDVVEQRLGFRPQGSVRLLTHPRHFGYAFNPVSFFLCADAAGATEAILAEVTNTPWNERHVYALDCRGRERLEFVVPKRLHVSPFMSMNMDYRFVFLLKDARVIVHKDNRNAGQVVFSATLDLERRSLTGPAMARALIRQPLMPWRVVGAIYWQALRLWCKGARYQPHPEPPASG